MIMIKGLKKFNHGFDVQCFQLRESNFCGFVNSYCFYHNFVNIGSMTLKVAEIIHKPFCCVYGNSSKLAYTQQNGVWMISATFKVIEPIFTKIMIKNNSC